MIDGSNGDVTPSLLDPQARGGTIAEGGFTFQSELILANIPSWLKRDAFIDMMREGLGDAEARFFCAEAGRQREFYEFKNHLIAPAEFWAEVMRFWTLDESDASAYSRFTLVASGASRALAPLVNALDRIRRAMPFYDAASAIVIESFADFDAIVNATAGRSDRPGIARFLYEKVWMDVSPPRTVSQGIERFRGELERWFPEFRDQAGRVGSTAYEAVASLVRASVGVPVTRAQLEHAIWSDASWRQGRNDRVRVFTASTKDWQHDGAIRFDWTSFSSKSSAAFPSPADWEGRIVAPLRALKTMICDTGRSRDIALLGQRRLSASLAIGSVFNAVSAFNIDLAIGDATYSTSVHPPPGSPDYPWAIARKNWSVNDELGVEIGILRSIDAQPLLTGLFGSIPILSLYGGEALISSVQTNLAVRRAKALIAEASAATGAKRLHLFYAGPAVFALFLGHRLNSLGHVQCYEWVSGCYLPSALLIDG